MRWTRCIMTDDVIVRRYIVPASSADPDLVRKIFRGRQYKLNGAFDDRPSDLFEDGIYNDGDIVYKYDLPAVDVTVGILSDPYRLEIESDGVLFGEIPLSKDDYLFLRVARKTARIHGGEGRQIVERSDGSARFRPAVHYPWEIVITGRARRKRK